MQEYSTVDFEFKVICVLCKEAARAPCINVTLQYCQVWSYSTISWSKQTASIPCVSVWV